MLSGYFGSLLVYNPVQASLTHTWMGFFITVNNLLWDQKRQGLTFFETKHRLFLFDFLFFFRVIPCCFGDIYKSKSVVKSKKNDFNINSLQVLLTDSWKNKITKFRFRMKYLSSFVWMIHFVLANSSFLRPHPESPVYICLCL